MGFFWTTMFVKEGIRLLTQLLGVAHTAREAVRRGRAQNRIACTVTCLEYGATIL
jgi:hypothetical protein